MKRRIALSAAVGPLLLASTAFAQTSPEEPVEVDEVVVTAAPFSVTEQALTANVDVVDEEELLLSPPATLGDLVAGMPGVRSSSFAPGASRPVIRGLAGPRVQVLVNGLGAIDASQVSPDHQVAADPTGASRIEIIRGPATLAYGGSAIGGVVNVMDDRVPEEVPADGVDGRLSIQAGSVDGFRAAAGALTFGNGPLVFTVQASDRHSDDYETPVYPESRRLLREEGEEPGAERQVDGTGMDLNEVGGGVSWVGDFGFVGVSVRRTESLYGVPGHAHEHEEDEHEDDHDDHDHRGAVEEGVMIDLRQTRYDLRGEARIGLGPFETLRFSGGYADYTHSELEDGETGTVFTSQGWEARADLVQKERDGWNGAVGFQALDRDFDARGDEAYIPATTISEVGVYTLQRLDRGPLGFEAGLRVDQRELDSLVGARDFTNVSGSAGVFFRPRRGLYFGLSVARNERAPTEVELFADGPHVATRAYEVGDPTFESEVATSIEAAAHYHRGRWTADLHLFAARYDGFIDVQPTGVIDPDSELEIFEYVQTDADFYGFEAEASYRFWEQGERSLSLEAAVDYVRGDTDIGPPARIPPWSVTGRLVYESPRWGGKLEVRRVGEQDRITTYELPTDGYTLVNLSASFRPFEDRGVIFFAEGRNLTDEEAREHASFLKDIAPMPGRGVRVGIGYRF